jgi:transcriptional regulator GlxA family with amidase domain
MHAGQPATFSERIRKIQDTVSWTLDHAGQPATFNQIAGLLGMETRTFKQFF